MSPSPEFLKIIYKTIYKNILNIRQKVRRLLFDHIAEEIMKERFRNLVVTKVAVKVVVKVATYFVFIAACIVSPLQAVAEHNFKRVHETSSSEKIHKFGFSKEGDYFYALKKGGNTQILETQSQKRVKTKLSDYPNSEAMWTIEPEKLFITSSHKPIVAFDVQRLQSEVITFKKPGRGPTIVSADGRFLMKGTEIYDSQIRSNYLISGLDYKIYQYSRWLSMSDDSNTVQMSTSNENGNSAAVLTYIDLETGFKLASWSPMWLLDSDIIESVLIRGRIAAIGMDNKKIKLWSYANNETVRSLSFEEDITFLKRDQKKSSERLMAWGDTSISVWESADWRGDILKKTLKHGSSAAIRKPSLSYDSQLVAFTTSGENTFQVKTMANAIAKPVGKSVGKSMRQLKGTLKVNLNNKLQEQAIDESSDELKKNETKGGEEKGNEAKGSEEKEAGDKIVLDQFNDEIQGIFSPTQNYLLTLNKSRNKLTLWQAQ